MFFSQLSELNNKFSADLIEKVDNYFAGLTPSALELITFSKLSLAIGEDKNICAEILEQCVKSDFLIEKYGCRCPFCQHLLKITGALDDFLDEEEYCHACDKTILIDKAVLIEEGEIFYEVKNQKNKKRNENG